MKCFNFAFVILIFFQICYSFYFNNNTFEDNDFTLLSEIPLNSNYDVNYRNAYNLRFDPNSIRRNIHLNLNSDETYSNNNDVSNVSNVNLFNDELLTNNGISFTENEDSSMAQENTNGIEKLTESNSPLSSTSPNIMKPYKTNNNSSSIKNYSPLNLIGNRLKNLLFSTAATLVKRPPLRSKGFLNLFDVIKFENIPCVVSSYNGIRMLNGTCYHRFECNNFGGVPMGVCAAGYGVCCIFKYDCDKNTNQIISYFENPKFPTPFKDRMACTFTLNLLPNVRQVRLDFLFFELRRPIEGNCVDDQFVVLGQNTNFFIPVICGVNTGQHIYVDVDNNVERKLFLSVFGRNPNNRSFSIRVMQLRNNCAPDGCLQYYTENYGIIKSFNYDNDANIVESRRGSYFNNMNYAICIQRFPHMCTITYTNEYNGREFEFDIVNSNTNFDDESAITSSERQNGAEAFNCPYDFITINSIRLCGNKLNDGSFTEDVHVNSPVTEYGSGPIILPFKTDNQTVGKGFKLLYYQEKCITNK